MQRLIGLLVTLLAVNTARAQLTPEQRVADFQNLAALFAKRYAPYDWKKQVFGFDLFNIQPWIDRVNAVPDDLGFFEVEAQYVAQLNDIHTGFSMTSSFSASLGMTVDIYDGKVLIDSINRRLLPVTTYPFQLGDELVSVDGKTAEQWIADISKFRQRSNPSNTRRAAAGQIAVRSQSVYPRAVEIGDTATVAINQASGGQQTYTIAWNKSGMPVTQVGPVPTPKAVVTQAAAKDVQGYLQALEEMHNWKLPDQDVALQPIPGLPDTEEGETRKFVLGYGSRAPIFSTGFPAGFTRRLGSSPSDYHYSGTYQAGGFTIGYLRIPSFSPASLSGTVKELESEIAYMQNNTDGLVLDVTHNPGGGCYMLDVAAHLISTPFYFFGEQIRATQDRLNSLESALEISRLLNADQWVIDTYTQYVSMMQEALQANRGLTAPIAACTQYNTLNAPVREGNQPASVVYTKPLIVLVDEFSTSAADIFPAMIQDNKRAPMVGTRTNGGGGSISSWETGFYSESQSSNTNSLVVRNHDVISPDLPPAPYVENIGVIPDIPLEYMTRENLMNGGRTYVQGFTDVIVGQIQSARQ